MQAVILAGGKGTRLADRLNGRPKPLIDVAGLPLLERQLQALETHGFDEVLLLVNHAADQISDFVASRTGQIRVVLIDDGKARGTAGAVLASFGRLADQFAVVYGDTLFDVDFDHMRTAHASSGAAVTLFLHPNDHPQDSDLVEIEEDGRVVGFHGYPHPADAEFGNLVNAALYFCRKDALEPWKNLQPPLDFAKDLFPRMVEAGVPIHGYVSHEYIKDLGTPARLDKGERHLRDGVVAAASRRSRQRAVFLDRDGTLNRLAGYVRRPSDLELIDGAARGVRRLNESDYRVVVVTNQPVLARGEADRSTMRRIHRRLETLLGRQGAWLDALYLCPHHPDAGFAGEVASLKVACECRKPGTAMFLQAMEDMNIDASRSWVIGDSTADMEAARRLGLRSILVLTGEGGRDGKWPSQPNFTAPDLGEAVDIILNAEPVREIAS